MLLTPEQFQAISTALFDEGMNDSNDAIHDALHSSATSALTCQLMSHGYSLEDQLESDLDQTQEDSLIQRYKDGFWELTHQTERTELRAKITKLRDFVEELLACDYAADVIDLLNHSGQAVLDDTAEINGTREDARPPEQLTTDN